MRWSIDDVVEFVESIDICKEYAEVSYLMNSYRWLPLYPPSESEFDIEGATKIEMATDPLFTLESMSKRLEQKCNFP